MINFKEISPKELAHNPFSLFDDNWGLVTAGTADKFNTMTVSWGGVGILWNKPVAFTFIRPQRYTFEFTESCGFCSVCFFGEEHRKALQFCGTRSGRDCDKVSETGLTPAFTAEGVPYFEEARLVLVCKKLYAQDMTPDSFTGDFADKFYNGADYHRVYVNEIVKAMVRS